MYYAQLDENGYCMAISDLGENVEDKKLIVIPDMNESYLKQKYDREKKCWIQEWKKTNIGINKKQPTDMELMMQEIEELKLMLYEAQTKKV